MPTWYYRLDDLHHGTPRQVPLLEWARWFETADRTLLRDTYQLPLHEGLITVSTVFLGIDQSFGYAHHPTLWETMIFNGPLHDSRWQYPTREAAVAGHAHACESLHQLTAVHVQHPDLNLLRNPEKET